MLPSFTSVISPSIANGFPISVRFALNPVILFAKLFLGRFLLSFIFPFAVIALRFGHKNICYNSLPEHKVYFSSGWGGGLLLLDPAIRPCVFCMPMMRWRCYHISLGVSGLCTTHSRYACCTLFSTKHQAEEQPNTANAIIRTKLSNFNSEIIRHFSMPYMVYVILIRVMPYIWLSAFLLYDFA